MSSVPTGDDLSAAQLAAKLHFFLAAELFAELASRIGRADALVYLGERYLMHGTAPEALELEKFVDCARLLATNPRVQ